MVIDQDDVIRDLRGELEAKDAAHKKVMDRHEKDKEKRKKRKRISMSKAAARARTKVAAAAGKAFATAKSGMAAATTSAATEIERRKREARQLKKTLAHVAKTSASRMKRLVGFKAKLEAADAAAMEQEEKNEELVDDLANALGTWWW